MGSDFSNEKGGVSRKGVLIKKVGIPYVERRGEHRSRFTNIRSGSVTFRKLSTFPLAFTY